jgi:hypothetical protein
MFGGIRSPSIYSTGHDHLAKRVPVLGLSNVKLILVRNLLIFFSLGALDFCVAVVFVCHITDHDEQVVFAALSSLSAKSSVWKDETTETHLFPRVAG